MPLRGRKELAIPAVNTYFKLQLWQLQLDCISNLGVLLSGEQGEKVFKTILPSEVINALASVYCCCLLEEYK